MPEPQRLGRDTHKKRNGKTNALDTLRRIVAYKQYCGSWSTQRGFDMRSETNAVSIQILLFPARTIFIFRFLKADAGNSPKANVLLKIRWTIYLPVTTAVSKAQAKG